VPPVLPTEVAPPFEVVVVVAPGFPPALTILVLPVVLLPPRAKPPPVALLVPVLTVPPWPTLVVLAPPKPVAELLLAPPLEVALWTLLLPPLLAEISPRPSSSAEQPSPRQDKSGSETSVDVLAVNLMMPVLVGAAKASLILVLARRGNAAFTLPLHRLVS
jgi:hypothetical protein